MHLLVEAANIDEVFEEKEKNIIATIIEKQFKIENPKLVKETIEKVIVKSLKDIKRPCI